MSRKIKFRIWDKKLRIFLLRDWKYEDKIPNAPLIDIDGRLFSWSSQHWGVDNELLENPDDYIILQFTGLLDENGKEIFEGDVVFGVISGLAGGNILREVKFKDGAFVIDTHYGSYPVAKLYPVEVKGNVFENPELIK